MIGGGYDKTPRIRHRLLAFFEFLRTPLLSLVYICTPQTMRGEQQIPPALADVLAEHVEPTATKRQNH